MAATRGDRLDLEGALIAPARLGRAAGVDRAAAVGRGAVSQLPEFVVATARHAARGRERAGVAVAGGDRRHPGGETLDGDRPRASGRRAVAELSVRIVAPALECAPT